MSWCALAWLNQVAMMKYILDIEGTVCPISFVKDTLYPYFLEQVPELVRTEDATLVALLSQFPVEKNAAAWRAYIDELVRKDVKDSVLKQLQGHLWQKGYESGAIEAPVYADAVEFIKRHAPDVYIYSSGSVKAQKLLFEHVRGSGDLTGYLSGYFDINTAGKKTESASYRKIVAAIGAEGGLDQITFISDNALELDAAAAAGIKTVLAVRPGNAEVAHAERYTAVTTFASL